MQCWRYSLPAQLDLPLQMRFSIPRLALAPSRRPYFALLGPLSVSGYPTHRAGVLPVDDALLPRRVDLLPSEAL